MINDEVYSIICRDIDGTLSWGQGIVARYNVQLPVLQGRGGSIGRINRFYSGRAGKIIEGLKRNQYPLAVSQFRELWRVNSFEPLHTAVSCAVMYQGENIISLFWDIYENNRTAGVNLRRESHTWDLKRGQLLPIWSFFKKNNWKSIILAQVEAQIKEALSRVPDCFYGDWKGKIGDIDGYYLTEEGIAVYYRAGFIASNAGAIPTFIIPYDKLGDILAKPL